MNWLRWYHGTSKDPKWRVIAKKAGVPVSTVIAIWATILENASENETERGVLHGWELDEVGVSVDETPETVGNVFDAMQGKTLDGFNVIAFTKRNPKRERDDLSTERVRKFRKRETPRNTTKRQETLEERRVDKSRKENTGELGADAPTPEPIIKSGEFGWAKLTATEFSKLKDKLNGHTDEYISRFDLWVQQAPDAKAHGVKRRDREAYASIRAWYDKDVKEGKTLPSIRVEQSDTFDDEVERERVRIFGKKAGV